MTKLISIVMPSYNQARFIDFAIDSVFEQSPNQVELIVADGGSTDGTQEILTRAALRYPSLRWLSEPDDGPADAINRAFSRVRGEIVGWLNSDDAFAPHSFDRVVAAFSENPDWIMCYGQAKHIDEFGKEIGPYPTQPPSVGLEGFRQGCFICQPTVFFKTPLLTLLGRLNTSLKTAFDYEFWVRAFKTFPERIGFIDTVLACSRLHDDCITERMRETVALEGLAIGQTHLGGTNLHWAITYLEELRTMYGQDDSSFESKASSFLSAVAKVLSESQMRNLKILIDFGGVD